MLKLSPLVSCYMFEEEVKKTVENSSPDIYFAEARQQILIVLTFCSGKLLVLVEISRIVTK